MSWAYSPRSVEHFPKENVGYNTYTYLYINIIYDPTFSLRKCNTSVSGSGFFAVPL